MSLFRAKMSQDSWAQLKIAESVFAYVPYRNFILNIYETTESTPTAAKKLFCSPICLLDNMSAESRFNVVKQQHEVRFRIHFYNEGVKQHVIRYLKDEMDIELKRSQLYVIPFERVILWSSTKTVGYEMSDWKHYAQDEYVWFTLNCSDELKAAQLAQEMKQRPDQFENFHLSFMLSSQKTKQRKTNIHIDSIVSGSMFTRLQQKYPEADSVLLTADDKKKLLSETRTKVLADTVHDNEIASSESALYGILERLIFSAQEITTKDSSFKWDSVFWNEDNCRPDKVCDTLNEEFNKSDKETKKKLSTSFTNDTDVNVDGIAKFIASANVSNKLKLTGEGDNQDRVMKEIRNNVHWKGEKFVPKPMTLSRVNLSTFGISQQFQDKNTSVTLYDAELTTPLRFSEPSQPQMQLGTSILRGLS
jgi:hypothetical protein